MLSWPSNRGLYVCAVTIVKSVDVSGMGGENTQFGHFSYATSGTWLTVSCRPLAAWSTKARVRAWSHVRVRVICSARFGILIGVFQ